MIELKLKGEKGYANEMMLFTEIIHWLTASIIESAEEVYLQGYVAIFDNNTSKLNILLLCGGRYQEKIKVILDNPPEMFKERYIVEVVKDESETESVPDDEEDEDEKEEKEEMKKEEGYDITVKTDDKEVEVEVREKT